MNAQSVDLELGCLAFWASLALETQRAHYSLHLNELRNIP